MIHDAAPPVEQMSPPRQTQFSLRSMLLLTAGVSAALGARPWINFGEFVLLLVLLGALANHLGMFGFMQARYVAKALLYVAAAAFAVSMFLKAIGGERGWKVAWETARDTYTGFNDPGPMMAIALWQTVYFTSTLANLAMFACPLLAHRLAAGKATWLRMLLAMSLIVPWSILRLADDALFLGFLGPEFLQIGYYVWAGSISLTGLVLPISRRQLLLLALLALWLVIAARCLPDPRLSPVARATPQSSISRA